MAATTSAVAAHAAVAEASEEPEEKQQDPPPLSRQQSFLQGVPHSPQGGCCALLLDSHAVYHGLEDDPDEPTFIPTSLPQKLFLILEDPNYNCTAQLVSIVILLLIVLGCITYVMESMRAFQYVKDRCDRMDPKAGECEPVAKPIFFKIEAVCIGVFTVEYVLRIVLVGIVPEKCWNPRSKKERSGLKRLRTYALQPMNVVDLVAILPFYIGLFDLGGGGFGVLRIVRLARALRMARSPKVAGSVAVFGKAMYASSPALGILFFFSMMAFVLAGSIIFMFERGHFSTDPDYRYLCRRSEDDYTPHGCYLRQTTDGLQMEASPYVNIPISMYWVVVTMTTTGYGDLYPTSTGGRIISILVVYMGIIAIALPITVIGTNFTREYDAYREMERRVAEKKKLRWKASLRRVVKNTPGGKGKVGAAPSPPAKNPDKELLEQLRSTLHQQKLGLEEISAKVEGIAARVLKT
jgi:hypothetical protein